MRYLEFFLQLAFVGVVFGCVGMLVFAVFAELFGWYDANGRYNGPLSKARRK